MRKILLLSLILVVLTGCIKKPDFEFTIETKNEPKDEEIVETPIIKADEPTEVIKDVNTAIETPEETVKESPMKDVPVIESLNTSVVDWPVPFAMQAPFSNWEMPYQEMCEEAALVISAKYYNKEPLDKTIMDEELKKIREWETEKWGLYTDSTVAEIKEMGEAIYKLKIEISDDVSIENIKNNLRKNYLVLAPTAGQELGNPFFKQPGPLYHVLVLRGFTDNSFIANDVGIGKGEGYKYKFQTVINAIHDLPVLEDGSIFRPFDEDLSESLKKSEMTTGIPRILIIKGLK